MPDPAEQRTDAWLSERAGKVTASMIAAVMSKLRDGKPGAERKNYMADLVAERLTGVPKQGFTNAAMQWGIDNEASARAMYELEYGVSVVETGFVPHPTLDMTGASPDGLVGEDGLVEIKCPNTATHIETLRGAKIDRKYLLQMHWQMICCERAWCDFASFDPRMPIEMQLHVQRVERDAELVEEITAEVTQFLTELNETVAALEATYCAKEAA